MNGFAIFLCKQKALIEQKYIIRYIEIVLSDNLQIGM